MTPRHLTSIMPKYHTVSMKPAKSMTIRLSAEQADALETVARVEELPISDVIRAAIESHITERKRDPVFQDNLKDRIKKAQRLLDR